MATFFAACLFAAATVLALFAIVATLKSHGALALQALRQSGHTPDAPHYLVRFRNGFAAPQAISTRPRAVSLPARRAATGRSVQPRQLVDCTAA